MLESAKQPKEGALQVYGLYYVHKNIIKQYSRSQKRSKQHHSRSACGLMQDYKKKK